MEELRGLGCYGWIRTKVSFISSLVPADRTAFGVKSDQGLIYLRATDPRVRARGKHIFTSTINRLDNALFLSAMNFLDCAADWT